MTVVHQLLSGAGPHDAITTEAQVFRRYFTEWGWGGGDFAYRMHPLLRAPIRPAAELAPAPGDVVLLHHSAGWPELDAVLGLPGHKLLLHHNVTPAEWFWIDAPGLAAHCQVGRDQLETLVAGADATAADSAFNAAELAAHGARRTEVIHLLLDHDRFGGPLVADRADGAAGWGHGSPAGGPGAPELLFVGRLSPHKRQDELIRLTGLLRRGVAPGARLTLVGDPINPEYVEGLRNLAARECPGAAGAVAIESGLADGDLAERYRRADVFVCLSEHEGFCIPLVEAFAFGVPVIARPFGAIPEVAGDAALLVPDPDLGVLAEAVALVAADSELRAELIARGRARLDAFSPPAIAERLRRAVLAAEAGR